MITTPLSPAGTDGHDQRAAAVDTHSWLPSSGDVVAGSHKILPADSDRAIPGGMFPETPID
jgi:hypothetical protein